MTAVLPQQQPYRADTQERIDLCLLPDEEAGTQLLNYVAERGWRFHAALGFAKRK